MTEYFKQITGKLESIEASQTENMHKAACIIDERLRSGNILHLFGSGHSHLAAAECLYRAGCFAPCNVILPKQLLLDGGAVAGTLAERQSGLAAGILMDYDVRSNDILVIFSQSGINNVPVEMAAEARGMGVYVLGIGSQKHSDAVVPRTWDGRRLRDHCDIFIDNQGEPGDACVELLGGLHCGPTSTITGVFIIQSILCEVAFRMVKDGITPPVYISANLGNADNNRELIEKYRSRIKHL
jgi:uncharacterized phosphosugar-binding protein